MRLPIALSVYNRDYGFLSYLPLRNLIVEKTPGDDEGVVLLPRPGLSVYRTLSGTDVKAVWADPGIFNGDDIALCGTTVYRAGTSLGTLSSAAMLGARSAFSGLEMVFCNDGALYHTNGSTLTNPSFPDGAQVISVSWLDNYFLAVRGNSAKLYWSAINDGTSWPALNFASAEANPGNLLDVIRIGDQVALCCQNSIEFWQPNPAGSADLPFIRIDGLTASKGIMNTGAAIYADNTLVWVGNDGIVYRRGAVPQRISNEGVEKQIAQASAAYLGLFNWSGHAILVLNLGTQTLFYDFQTQLWGELTTNGFAGWRAQAIATNGKAPLFADAGSAAILQLDETALTDNGATVERMFACLLPPLGSVDNLWLDAQGGVGTEPTGAAILVETTISRDGSQTFGPWLQSDLGKRGEYRKRAAWRRLGNADWPGGVMWFRCTDPAMFTVQSVRVNEPMAGRAS